MEIDKTAPFGNGPWLGPNLNAVDRGRTYQVRVTDGETGNKFLYILPSKPGHSEVRIISSFGVKLLMMLLLKQCMTGIRCLLMELKIRIFVALNYGRD